MSFFFIHQYANRIFFIVNVPFFTTTFTVTRSPVPISKAAVVSGSRILPDASLISPIFFPLQYSSASASPIPSRQTLHPSLTSRTV